MSKKTVYGIGGFKPKSTGKNIIEDADARSLIEAQTERLDMLKDFCRKAILKDAPEFKQRNAALGLLEQSEVDAISAHLQTNMAKSEQKKQEVLKATNNDDVDAIGWTN